MPKRSGNTRPVKEFWEVPHSLRRVYLESIDCYNNDSYTLIAACLRALIEGLCAQLVFIDEPKAIAKADGTLEVERLKNLEGKISGLHEKSFLTEKAPPYKTKGGAVRRLVDRESRNPARTNAPHAQLP